MIAFYPFGRKLAKFRTIRKAIPMPKSKIINGILPFKTEAVEDAKSVTMVVGIVIFYYLPFGICVLACHDYALLSVFEP